MAKLSMDGFLRSVKLIPNRDDDRYDDDYDDYEEDDELDEEEEETAPRRNVRTSRFGRKPAPAYNTKDDDYDEYEDDAEETGSYYSAPARSQQAVNKAVGAVSGTAQRNTQAARSGKRPENPSDVNVRIFHPKTIEDANSIADELVSEKIVVMNLEEVDMAAAQRIVDFVSGACYSVDGNLQKIAKKAFIVTPKNANLSSEMGNIIREAVGLSSVNIMK